MTINRSGATNKEVYRHKQGLAPLRGGAAGYYTKRLYEGGGSEPNSYHRILVEWPMCMIKRPVALT
jgi:hypothetical protein